MPTALDMLHWLNHPRLRGARGAFLKESSAALLLRVLAAICNYGSALLLAKLLPGADYGQYATIMSSLLLASVVSLQGYDITLTRFLGRYTSHGQPGLAHGLMVRGRRAALTGSSFIMAISLAVLIIAHIAGSHRSMWPYVIAACFLVPFTLIDIQSAVLRIHRHIIAALAPRDVFWRIGQIALIGILAMLLPPQDRLMPFLLLSLATLTILSLLQKRILKRSIPPLILKAPIEEDAESWQQSSRANWLLMVARTSFRSLDVLVVGAVLSLGSAGLYFAVSRTAELMGFVLASLNQVIGPNISRAVARGDHDELQDILGISSAIVFAPSLALMIVYLFFGREVMGLFGPQFADTYPALLLMGLGQLANAATGSAGVALNMTGHESVNARILMTAAPVNLALVVAGALAFGTTGAAAGSMLGMIGWNWGLWKAARQYAGVDTSFLSAIAMLLRMRRKPA